MRTNFKKHLLIIGITFVLIAVTVVILYNNAQKPYEKTKETALQQLQDTMSLTEVEKVYLYNGTTAYYTGTGKNKSGKRVAVWLARDGKSDPVVLPLDEGITEKEARALFKEEAGSVEILSLTLGIENKTPVWLFTFKSETGGLNYYFLTFTDGKWWKKVENI